MVNLDYAEPEQAVSSASKLLSKETGAKFFQVVDRDDPRNVSCVLIKQCDELIGFATITFGDDTCEIYRFYIAPEHRGSGLGTIAARLLDKDLQDEPFDTCFLQIDDVRTLRFWEHALGPLEVANETANMYRKDY
ncbi:GNAT family N-acetyltransferase [Pseudomonas soli]|uniref:GNAT family N-acetyltransferase n=1 Tax=Pseudomonas soli TaxID=1306993 RepID=UPI00380DA15A